MTSGRQASGPASGPVGAGWDAADRLDPERVRPRLERNLMRALKRIGEKFVALAVKAIRAKKYAANSEVTIALKNASTPLVSGGKGAGLMQSITYVIPPGTLELWVGANRNATAEDGKPMANLVRILHDGATIDVQKNPKVRIALMANLRSVAKTGMDRDGKKGNQARARRILQQMKQAGLARNRRAAAWTGWGKGKSLYIIPPRPFLADILKDAEFLAFVDAEMRAAVARTIMPEAA